MRLNVNIDQCALKTATIVEWMKVVASATVTVETWKAITDLTPLPPSMTDLTPLLPSMTIVTHGIVHRRIDVHVLQSVTTAVAIVSAIHRQIAIAGIAITIHLSDAIREILQTVISTVDVTTHLNNVVVMVDPIVPHRHHHHRQSNQSRFLKVLVR
jgi:hypothetical protein